MKTLRTRIGLLAGIVISCCTAFSAKAQFVADETKIYVQDGTSWVYFPGIVNEEVVGFLAVRVPAPTNRTYVGVAWFQRVAPGEFSKQTWLAGTSGEDAAAEVALDWSEPDMFEYANFDPSEPIDDEEVLGRPMDGGGEAESPCNSAYLAGDVMLAGAAATIEMELFGEVSTASEMPTALNCCLLVPEWCITTYRWSPTWTSFSLGTTPPSCRWSNSGFKDVTCGTWCGGAPTTTTTVTSRSKTCPAPAPGACGGVGGKPPC